MGQITVFCYFIQFLTLTNGDEMIQWQVTAHTIASTTRLLCQKWHNNRSVGWWTSPRHFCFSSRFFLVSFEKSSNNCLVTVSRKYRVINHWVIKNMKFMYSNVAVTQWNDTLHAYGLDRNKAKRTFMGHLIVFMHSNCWTPSISIVIRSNFYRFFCILGEIKCVGRPE